VVTPVVEVPSDSEIAPTELDPDSDCDVGSQDAAIDTASSHAALPIIESESTGRATQPEATSKGLGRSAGAEHADEAHTLRLRRLRAFLIDYHS